MATSTDKSRLEKVDRMAVAFNSMCFKRRSTEIIESIDDEQFLTSTLIDETSASVTFPDTISSSSLPRFRSFSLTWCSSFSRSTADWTIEILSPCKHITTLRWPNHSRFARNMGEELGPLTCTRAWNGAQRKPGSASPFSPSPSSCVETPGSFPPSRRSSPAWRPSPWIPEIGSLSGGCCRRLRSTGRRERCLPTLCTRRRLTAADASPALMEQGWVREDRRDSVAAAAVRRPSRGWCLGALPRGRRRRRPWRFPRLSLGSASPSLFPRDLNYGLKVREKPTGHLFDRKQTVVGNVWFEGVWEVNGTSVWPKPVWPTSQFVPITHADLLAKTIVFLHYSGLHGFDRIYDCKPCVLK